MPDSALAAAPRETVWHRAGGGSALVFIHGVGMDAGIWQPQVAEFIRGRTVITYDMLGHGGSTLPPESPTLGDYAVQLAALLDQLGIVRAALVGHSMGALVALQFALTHPGRVSRLVAMNAVYQRSVRQREAVERRAASLGDVSAAAGVRSTIARWFGDPVPAPLHEAAGRVAALLMRADPVGYARTYRLFATADRLQEGMLHRLAMPALFLTGALDPNSTPEMSYAMAVEAPLGRAEVLPGERHMMALTTPALVNARLRAFLDAPEG